MTSTADDGRVDGRDGSSRARPPVRAPDRPQRSAADGTRRRLLDAGRDAFSRSGLAGTPVQRILDAADLAPPALYHHFGSKSGLFLAVAEEVYGRFVSELRDATRDAKSFDDALDRMIATAGRLHRSEQSLAPMAITVQIEVRRDPDLRLALGHALGSYWEFVEDVVDRAPPEVRREAGRRPLVLAVSSLLDGLTGLAVTLKDPGEFDRAAHALRLVIGVRDRVS